MRITCTSILSGKAHERDLNVTLDELRRWEGGELTQHVWPHLSVDDREFLITGVTPEEAAAIGF